MLIQVNIFFEEKNGINNTIKIPNKMLTQQLSYLSSKDSRTTF